MLPVGSPPIHRRTMIAVAMLSAVEGARVRPIRMIGNLLSGLTQPLPDPIDYSELRGMPKSFGREAGEYAVKGEVPTKSKDNWAIATFGGGCFWGTGMLPAVELSVPWQCPS